MATERSFLVLCLIALLSGCGGSSSTNPSPAPVTTVNTAPPLGTGATTKASPATDTPVVISVPIVVPAPADPLPAVEPAPVAAPVSPATDPATQPVGPTVSKYALVISGGIHVYLVDPTTGAWTENPKSPFAPTLHPSSVQIDSNDQFVYAITGDGESATGVATFAMAKDGTLTLINTNAALADAAAILVDPTNQFLYTYSDSEITDYLIDPNTGLLTETSNVISAPIPFRSHFGFSADGSILYDGSGAAYNVDPQTGALTSVQNPVIPLWYLCTDDCTQNLAAGTTYEADYGRFSDHTTGNLDAYDSSENLLESEPFNFGDGNFSIVFDVSGTYAYEYYGNSDGSVTVQAYSVATSGALSPAPFTLTYPASVTQIVMSN